MMKHFIHIFFLAVSPGLCLLGGGGVQRNLRLHSKADAERHLAVNESLPFMIDNLSHAVVDKKSTVLKKRQQLKDYFQDRQSQMKIVTTTFTNSGQIIHWIYRNAQDNGKVASPPPDDLDSEEMPEGKFADITEAESFFELLKPEAMLGPEGTVPVLLGNFADIIDDDDLPDTVEDYLSKYGNKNDIPSQISTQKGGHNRRHLQSIPIHKYVTTSEKVANFGGQGYINVWAPIVAEKNQLSLAQVSVSSGDQVPLQTVECGWQVLQARYGDSYPHLFTFFTTNGYASHGNYMGGYNLDVAGFVQYSKTIFPGARISAGTFGGPQYAMQVKVRLYQGNWWVAVAGHWMGYYPAKLYSSQTTGLVSMGGEIRWFGEVTDAPDGKPTKTWMGSGIFADQGFGYAAYMRNILTYSEDCTCATAYSPLYDPYYITDSNCYSYDPYFNSGTSWGSYFYFGGPGAFVNANCNQE